MDKVICWLWGDSYKAEHVNVLKNMVDRHIGWPLLCITDQPEGITCETMPIPEEAKRLENLQTLEAKGFPSCYRRLWNFSKDVKKVADRAIFIDVDVVICDNFRELAGKVTGFVGNRPKLEWGQADRINGAMYAMETGEFSQVWEDFKGKESQQEARAAGFRGSDQAWISYKLRGIGERWSTKHGIWSVSDFEANPPAGARMVFCNGRTRKPWMQRMQRREWVQKHWR